MADYTARTYWRAYRVLSPPFRTLPDVLQTSEYEAQDREERSLFREHASELRAIVRAREWIATLDLMAQLVTFGVPHICFLERAFPLMTAPQRASCLQYVWCRCKEPVPPGRALRLFLAASLLRKTVPATWPADVRVYRGAVSPSGCSDPWRRATRRVRRGISWTTDRATAEAFARRMPDDMGCLGTATIPRTSTLAYFHDPREIELYGRRFPVDGFHEHECIIDPSAIKRITYKRVGTTNDSDPSCCAK